MTFVQMLSFRSFHGEQIKKLLEEWERAEKGKAPGYLRSWLLKDRDRDDTYMISVEFSSFDEAEKNNVRPATKEWAEKLRHMVEGEVGYRNYDLVWGG